jgi:hypothetical protein
VCSSDLNGGKPRKRYTNKDDAGLLKATRSSTERRKLRDRRRVDYPTHNRRSSSTSDEEEQRLLQPRRRRSPLGTMKANRRSASSTSLAAQTNLRRCRGNISETESKSIPDKRVERPRYRRCSSPEKTTLTYGSPASTSRGVRLSHVMKPPKYDGTSSVDTFLVQFDTCAEYNSWSDDQRCANLKCCLTGNVGQLLWESGDPSKLSYAVLIDRLKARYGTAGRKEMFVTQLRSRRRGNNESLAELHRDIRKLMALAYPNTSGSDMHEEIAKKTLHYGLE